MLLFAIRRNLSQFSFSDFPSQSVTGVGYFLRCSSSEKMLLVIHFRQVRTRVGIRRVSRAWNLCLLFPNDSHIYAATERKQLNTYLMMSFFGSQLLFFFRHLCLHCQSHFLNSVSCSSRFVVKFSVSIFRWFLRYQIKINVTRKHYSNEQILY